MTFHAAGCLSDAMRDGGNVAQPSRNGLLPTLRRVAAATLLAEMSLGGLVTGDAVTQIRLADPLVAIGTPHLSMLARKRYRVNEAGLQIHSGPFLAVARLVGTEARVVGAVGDLPMTRDTGIVSQHAMIPQEVGLSV